MTIRHARYQLLLKGNHVSILEILSCPLPPHLLGGILRPVLVFEIIRNTRKPQESSTRVTLNSGAGFCRLPSPLPSQTLFPKQHMQPTRPPSDISAVKQTVYLLGPLLGSVPGTCRGLSSTRPSVLNTEAALTPQSTETNFRGLRFP